MRTKNIKAKETDSWALPGKSLSLDEFKAGIKKAEKGPFYTVEESKNMLEEWRKKRNSR
jgi:predicted transcriptional regulator